MADVSLNSIEFEIRGSSDGASNSVDKLTSKLNGLKSALSGVAAVSKFSVAIKNVGESAKKATGSMSNFLSSIKRIAMYRAIRGIIKSITDALKEGWQNFYMFSKQTGAPFAKSLDDVSNAASQMKNQLGAAFGELFQAVAPILETLIGLVTKFFNILTMLFAKLAGKSGWYRAKGGADAVAQAVSGVGSAAKEAMKYLAPFDELNVMDDPNRGHGGGSASSNTPDYSNMYEWVPFEEYDIGQGITDFIEGIADAIDGINHWIESINWSELPAKVVQWIKEAFSDEGAITHLAESISEFIGASFGASLAYLWGGIKVYAKAIWEYICDAFTNDDGSFNFGAIFGGWIILGIEDFLANAATWLYEHIAKPFYRGLFKAFGMSDEDVAEWEKKSDEIFYTLMELLGRPFHAIHDWFVENVWDPIVQAFNDFDVEELKASAKAMVEGWLQGVKDFFAGIKAWFDEHIGGPIKEWLANSKLGELVIGFKTNLSNFKLPNLASFKKTWDSIKNKTATMTAKLKGTAASVFSTLSSKWGSIVTKASTLTANLKKSFTETTLNSIKTAWEGIKTKAATFTAKLSASTAVQNFIKLWDNLKNKSIGLAVNIAENVRNTWNKAADAWNGTSWLSKLVTLPRLARGGIVDEATLLGGAIVGEDGAEAIIPLENNTEWIGKVADELARKTGTTAVTIDYGRLATAMYTAMSRALAENPDDRNIMLDGDVVYRKMVQKNRQETYRMGVNPMMV